MTLIHKPPTRRAFLRQAATIVSGMLVVPRHVIAGSGTLPPSEKVNIAGIGVGGVGAADLHAVEMEANVVALCDVDSRRAASSFRKFRKAKRHVDFRRMFDEMHRDIDAVIVATPDHTHAVAAMAALKLGKHVYCEKPLAHSIGELRQLVKVAREMKAVTQMGIQGHAFDSIRAFCEWIWDGAIGQVHTIHAGCGLINSGIDDLPRLQERPPIPPELDWDLWIGPAKERPYHPVYLPATWRGWTSFGNGTIGDWACHVLDPVFWALDLQAPSTIRAETKNYDPVKQADVFPKGEIVSFDFPAREKRGPVTLKWYSGTEKIPRPTELESDENNIEIGAVVVGERGTIVYGSHGAGQVRIVPQSRMDAYRPPTKSIPRVLGHHWEWLQCIRNRGKPGAEFSYAGPLSEIALLGVIAVRLSGQTLHWDTKEARFTNSEEANRLIAPRLREGWELT